MNKRIVPFLCLNLLVLLLLPGYGFTNSSVRAAGNQIFVSTIGSGISCTQAMPCTLTQGITNAVDYDTVILEGGTYWAQTDPLWTISNSISLLGGWDGASAGEVVIDPHVYQTVLHGQGGFAILKIDDASPVDKITIKGITFMNGYAEAAGAYSFGGAIYVDNGDVMIEDNYFIDNYAEDSGGAIYINSFHDALITGNTFINNVAEDNGGGVFVYIPDPLSTMVTIEGNFFTGGNANSGAAARVYTSDSQVLVANNFISDTLGWSAIQIESYGPSTLVCNNFIIRPQQNGLDFMGVTAAAYQIWNNTITDAIYGIISFSNVKTNTVNNIIVDTDNSIVSYGGVLTGSHNLFYMNGIDDNLLSNPINGEDPLFVNPALDDYHIQAGSPAQDTGKAVDLSIDFDGQYRPMGSGFDIGADEVLDDILTFLPLIIR